MYVLLYMYFIVCIYTYLDVSHKIHFNWSKDSWSKLVWGEKVFVSTLLVKLLVSS